MENIFYAISDLADLLKTCGVKKFLLVCGKSFDTFSVADEFVNCKIPFCRFSSFTSNPKYEEVCEGVAVFKKNDCDAIVAVGGGSAIDTAKCIKVFSSLDSTKNFLLQKIDSDTAKNIPLIVLPTTAGTGSEATQFAVIYDKGKKVSVDFPSLLPNCIIKETTVLENLPLYQKKSTLLDALCHAIESWWCVNSTNESITYSKKAISLIIKNMDSYINGTSDDALFSEMFDAAYFAGRAINITRTTAAHAMSYKLTSLYGIAHGHAVFLCLPKIWKYMTDNLEKHKDARRKESLAKTFDDIAISLGCKDSHDAISYLEKIAKKWQLSFSHKFTDADLETLVNSVDANRLGNNPVPLDKNAIRLIYNELSIVD